MKTVEAIEETSVMFDGAQIYFQAGEKRQFEDNIADTIIADSHGTVEEERIMVGEPEEVVKEEKPKKAKKVK